MARSTCACPTSSRPDRARGRGEGLSVNAWLVRAAAAAARATEPSAATSAERRSASKAPQRYARLGTPALQEDTRCQHSRRRTHLRRPRARRRRHPASTPSDRTDTVVEVRPSDPAKQGRRDRRRADPRRATPAAGSSVTAPERVASGRPAGGRGVDRRAHRAADRIADAAARPGSPRCAARASSAHCRFKTGRRATSTSTQAGPARAARAPATSASATPSGDADRPRPAPASCASARSTAGRDQELATATPGSATSTATLRVNAANGGIADRPGGRHRRR